MTTWEGRNDRNFTDEDSARRGPTESDRVDNKGYDDMDDMPVPRHRECISHHHACDCREAKFAELERRNAAFATLYNAVNEMMAPLGYHGQIYAKDDRVRAVMDALHDIDGGVFKPMPVAALASQPQDEESKT